MASPDPTLAIKKAEYWNKYQTNTRNCHFPRLGDGFDGVDKGELHCTVVSPCVSKNDLEAFCGLEYVSTSTVLKLIWALVLGSYVGDSDVGFNFFSSGSGSTIAGISRIFLDERTTIHELLQLLETDSTASYNYHMPSLSDIWKASGTNNYPPFNSILCFDATTEDVYHDWLSFEGTSGTSSYIIVNTKLNESNVEVSLTHSTAYVSISHAANVADTFANTFLCVLKEPERRICEMNNIGEYQKRTIFNWNDTYPTVADTCAHTVIQEQVLRQPDALAVSSQDESLTYQELNYFSDILARTLVNSGIGPEIIVPLCFEKSIWAVVALLGVVKAGGCFVFLEISHPEARLKDILRQVKAKLLLTSTQFAYLSSGFDLPLIVASQKTIIEQAATQTFYQLPSVKPENMLYIVFTSGSTGKPKGCVVEHRAFCTAVRENTAKSGETAMSSNSRVLQHSPYTFDVSVWEIVGTLMVGGCVCTPTQEVSAKGIAYTINTTGTNWVFLTPSLAKLIRPEDVPGLKTLALGGEPLERTVVETWAGHVQLIHAYGPSECTVAAVGNPHMSLDLDPQNIGRATGAICWLVLPQDHNRLAPIGAVGELMIEGPMLARGYLNEPEKTAAVFIYNPTWWNFRNCPERSGRFYKTGDLVRYNTDGNLIFIGRKDTQKKLRGQRLEIFEIEHHIKSHKQVNQAIVALPKIGPCENRLVVVLFLQSSSASPPGAELQIIDPTLHPAYKRVVDDVQQILSNFLPQFMIPTVWLTVSRIPLTGSGKLDRRRVDDWVSQISRETYEAMVGIRDVQAQELSFLTGMEKDLQACLCRVLGLDGDKVSMESSFIALGGDSISAMKLLMECQASGIEVTLPDILQSKQISDLSLRAKYRADNAAGRHMLSPISPMQKMYLTLTSPITSGSICYGEGIIFRFGSFVPADNFKRAFELVVKRHPMLRARFERDQGGWTQRVTSDPSESNYFTFHSIQEESELDSIFRQICSRLNAQHGLVMSGALASLDGETQYLLMAAHCLVIDRDSWKIIIEDIENALSDNPLRPLNQANYQNWPGLHHIDASGCVFQEKQIRQRAHKQVRDIHPEASLRTPLTRPSFTVDIDQIGVTLDQQSTEILFSKECHSKIQTGPIDLIASVLIYTFRQAFAEHLIPDLHLKHSARQVLNDKRFLNVVGCFTAVTRILGLGDAASFVDIVRRVKDSRCRSPYGNCSPLECFQLNKDASLAYKVKLCLDCTLLQQQLREQEISVYTRALARPVIFEKHEDTQPLGLVNVVADNTKGGLIFTFKYAKHTRLTERLASWIDLFQNSIISLCQNLLHGAHHYSLSDFPLLQLTYGQLDQIENGELLQMEGTSLENVEDIYPCSPLQEGLLLSQVKFPGFYKTSILVEIAHSDPRGTVESVQVGKAWKQVVERHPSLRTTFIPDISNTGGFNQVVLKHVEVNIKYVTGSARGTPQLDRGSVGQFVEFSGVPHCLTVYESATNRLFCQLDISHAIIDAVSLSIILRDLALAYNTKLLTADALPFSKYIEYTSAHGWKESLAYWKEHLEGVRPCYFPHLDGVSGEKTMGYSEFHIEMTASHFARFAQMHDVTVFSIVQLAWGLVLRAYCASDEVSFFYTTAGRHIALQGIEEGVGAFMNTLICRIQFGPHESILSIMKRLKDGLTSALKHHIFPLAEIQHRVNTEGSSLSNTCLTFLKGSDTGIALEGSEGGLRYSIVDEIDRTEFDIHVQIIQTKEVLKARLDYWNTAMSSRAAESVLSTFTTLFKGIVTNVHHFIGDMEAFSEQNRRDVLDWNREVPEALAACMHEIVAQRVEEQPDAPAICSWDGNLTYKDLNALSDRLAHYLAGLGVGPEVMVPLCFDKSMWAVVAMLAVLKAGGVCVPLGPSHPDQRLQVILGDTQAKVILAGPPYIQRFRELVPTVIEVGMRTVSSLPDTRGAVCSNVRPDNAAFVVYTSGSTGVPKGVVLEHSALCTSSAAHGAAFGITRESRVLQFASYTFDVSIGDIFTTLQRGGCVCVISEDDRMNNLAGAINALGANWMNVTTTVAGLLHPSAVPSVQTLVLVGEPVSPSIVKRWAPHVMMFNSYGVAESSVVQTTSVAMNINSKAANIGYPLASRLWVVEHDNHDRLVPVGCIGELLIEGPLLARGYLNDAQKTRASFIEDPAWVHLLGLGSGHRMYKTGDLVQYSPDGALNYIGRKDRQIKVRGQRVEPAEIEQVLQAAVPSARNIVVDLVDHTASERVGILAAFIQPLTTAGEIDTPKNAILPMPETLQEELVRAQTHLSASLPSYMIPAIYIPLHNIPINLSGKLDRQKLAQIIHNLSESQLACYTLASANPQQPSTILERKIQQLWANVLGVTPNSIGVDNSFFQVGGDSLLAMKLSSAARNQDLHLTVADIFHHPVLSDMARYLTSRTMTEAYKIHAEIKSSSRSSNTNQNSLFERSLLSNTDLRTVIGVFPTTEIQAAFVAGATSTSRWQLNYFILDGHGPLDHQRFKRGCARLVAHYPILRTVFLFSGNQYFQVVLDHISLDIQTYEVDDVDHCAQSLRQDDMHIPPRLGEPFIAFAMVKHRKSKRHLLVMRISHAQYDGASLPQLWTSLQAAFAESPLPHSPPFSAYVSHAMQSNGAAYDYWQNLLEGSSMTLLNPSISRIPAKTSVYHNCSGRKLSLLQNQIPDITIATIIKAAWAVTLARQSSSPDVVFGQVISGRNTSSITQVEDILGPCLNVIPVRVQIDLQWSIHELLSYIQVQQLESIPFETLGFREILTCTQWPPLARYGTAILYQNIAFPAQLSLDDTTYDIYSLGDHDVGLAELTVIVAPEESGIRISIQYLEDSISAALAEHLLAVLCATVEFILVYPQERITHSTLWDKVPVSEQSLPQ